jgi:predicted aspartyl protease
MNKKIWKLFSLIALIILFTFHPQMRAADENLTDPYKIFHKYLEARGGLDKLLAVRTFYAKAEFKSRGLDGIYEVWRIKPHKKRIRSVLGTIESCRIDNGNKSWILDRMGKCRAVTDPNSIKRREIAKRIAMYEHVDPDSDVFTLELKKMKKIQGIKHYVIRLSNTINSDSVLYYIDSDTFLLTKTVDKDADSETETCFSDYREVAGIKWSFREESRDFKFESKTSYFWRKVEVGRNMPSSLFERPSDSVKRFSFPAGVEQVTVPFYNIEDKLYLEAHFGDIKGVWWVDSGAGATSVALPFVEKMKFEMKGKFKSIGAGHKTKSTFVTLPSYRIGDIHINSHMAITSSNHAKRELPRELRKHHFIGLLGYEFLSQFVTRIDLKAGKMTFYMPSTFTYRGKGKIVKATLYNGHISIQGQPENRKTGKFLLDTGAQLSNLNYYAVRECRFMGRARRANKIRVIGIGGETIMGLLKLKTFNISGITIKNPVFMAAMKEGAGFFGSKEYMGIIGMNVLKYFVFYLDYERQRVIFDL